jgi:hypothetical protein
LCARIGDPYVREVLRLLDACYPGRFGSEIALGSGAPPMGGPEGIAAGR